MTALLDAWRRRHPRAFRIGLWYSLGAVSLPLLWLAALGLAPEAGLTRSYWYPVDASTEPFIEERITAIDLAFIDERHRPTRNYRVRWDGVWFSPRAERVDFYAGADDRVILRVDGETILERSPAVGMHTVGRTVELGAGAHRLEIEHWQHGGARSLSVQWAPAGGTPAIPGPTRLFPEDPGALGYWLQVAAVRLPVLILLVWTTGVAVLVGLMVCRAFYRRVTSLSPAEHWHHLRTVLFPALLSPSQLLLFCRGFYRRITSLSPAERWRRLRTVLFPALLGPSQLLLFGPWTVHETNRTEFLVGFWELAPGWVWLLGPVVGVLAGLSIVMPARWFPRYVAALCAVGVLLWAQGNLLLADYGLLDGGELDLASHAWRTPFEAGLWVCVLLLAVIFANRVARVAPVACVALVTLQATVLVVPVGRMVTADAPSTPGAETAGGCRRQRSMNSQPHATSSTSCSTRSRHARSSTSWTPTGPPSIATGPVSRSSPITSARTETRRRHARDALGHPLSQRTAVPRVRRSPSIRLPHARTAGVSTSIADLPRSQPSESGVPRSRRRDPLQHSVALR